MVKVVLQPASNNESRVNYRETMESTVDLDSIKSIIQPSVYKDLEKIYPDKQINIWGVKPAKDNGNKINWQTIKYGDKVLFGRDKKMFSSATITYTVHEKKLALDLWDSANEETWEYIYFVKDIKSQNIDYSVLNNLLDYSSDNSFRRFNVLKAEKSDSITNNYDL